MSDYRDPKVTTPRRGTSNPWTWIGIALAVLVIALLVWWFWPDNEVAVVDEPPAAVEEGPATQ